MATLIAIAFGLALVASALGLFAWAIAKLLDIITGDDR